MTYTNKNSEKTARQGLATPYPEFGKCFVDLHTESEAQNLGVSSGADFDSLHPVKHVICCEGTGLACSHDNRIRCEMDQRVSYTSSTFEGKGCEKGYLR